MAHMVFYCDESGKYPADAVTFSGFVASADTWNKFKNAWNDLRIRLEVPPIHMGRIYHPEDNPEWSAVKGRWGKDWESKRDGMLLQFANIVFESDVACVGSVLDCRAFDKMHHLKTTVGDPQYLTFEHAIISAVKRVPWGDSNGLLGLIVDDDPEKAVDFYKLLGLLRKKEELEHITKRISAICFANDEHYTGIQAADMVAYESRNLMRTHLPPSELFLRLTRNLTYQPLRLDEATLTLLEDEARRIIDEEKASASRR